MQIMSVHVKKFQGDYDTKTKCLTVKIVKGNVLKTEIDEFEFKVELTFDPEATWLMGEMVDTLRKSSLHEFGTEPSLLPSSD